MWSSACVTCTWTRTYIILTQNMAVSCKTLVLRPTSTTPQERNQRYTCSFDVSPSCTCPTCISRTLPRAKKIRAKMRKSPGVLIAAYVNSRVNGMATCYVPSHQATSWSHVGQWLTVIAWTNAGRVTTHVCTTTPVMRHFTKNTWCHWRQKKCYVRYLQNSLPILGQCCCPTLTILLGYHVYSYAV